MVLCYFKIKKLKRIYFCDTIIRTRSVISLKKAIAVCLAAAMIFGTVSMISAGAKTVKAGDADLNGKVNVVDATIIQMNVAGLNEFSDAQKTVADLDKNGKIEITDATTVQKISAEQEINDEQFEISDEPFTEPPTEPVYTDEEIESKGSQAMNDYVNSLTGERLTNILNNMSVPESGVDTKLPKFEVEYNDELSDNLQALGMKEAFTSNADFKNMLADKNAASPFVSEVLHKTVISVNEEGTRAAAVTATINIGSASGDEDRKVYLNRPFLYMIINTKTNTPIFIGTVENLPNVEN